MPDVITAQIGSSGWVSSHESAASCRIPTLNFVIFEYTSIFLGNSVMTDKEEAMVALLQTEVNGIEVNALGEKLNCSQEEAQTCLNQLLTARLVELVRARDEVRVQLMREGHADLSDNEATLLELIEKGGNKGVWIKDLREKSGVGDKPMRKALKILETKKLIKVVKGVGTTKKCYMPYGAEADDSITGGTFYSDGKIDEELVQTLLSFCVTMLANRREQAITRHPVDVMKQREASFATAGEMATIIRGKKVLHVPISDGEIERIFEVAVLDGLIERRGDGAVRAADQSIIRASPLVSTPCALCPVATDCAAGIEINPCDCKYLSDWLAAN